jgi:hypothetical protein
MLHKKPVKKGIYNYKRVMMVMGPLIAGARIARQAMQTAMCGVYKHLNKCPFDTVPATARVAEMPER